MHQPIARLYPNPDTQTENDLHWSKNVERFLE